MDCGGGNGFGLFCRFALRCGNLGFGGFGVGGPDGLSLGSGFSVGKNVGLDENLFFRGIFGMGFTLLGTRRADVADDFSRLFLDAPVL